MHASYVFYPRAAGLKRSHRRELERTLKFGLNVLASYLDNDNELEALVRALGGGYVAPGVGGDVIRSPEALPSGRNLFQFDPTKVPEPDLTSSLEDRDTGGLGVHFMRNLMDRIEFEFESNGGNVLTMFKYRETTP